MNTLRQALEVNIIRLLTRRIRRCEMNTLRQALEEYLNLRRILGFKLLYAGKVLHDFVTYMEQHRASYITQALALSWAQQPVNVQPSHWAQRLSFVRGFARYRSASDSRTQIPSQGLLPFQPKRARPYLYSDDEIKRLLSAALKMPCRYERGALRPWVFHCLFGLLSVSDLRLSEACNLELQDIDLKAAVLTVRGTKFGKTRLVPLHSSTCKVLADYIARRERHWAGRPVSSYLFVSSLGNRLDGGEIHRTFGTGQFRWFFLYSVIPAKAGIYPVHPTGITWIPAFAGMTRDKCEV